MLNRRISLRAAAFTLKCAGVQLCISQLCCSPPRGEGFQREGTRTSRSLWPVGGMGFLRERGNRNPLFLKPFFGHFLSAKKVTRRRQPRAGRRETSLASGGKRKKRAGQSLVLRGNSAEKREPCGSLFFYSAPSGILAIIVLYTCRKNSSVRVRENTSAMG